MLALCVPSSRAGIHVPAVAGVRRRVRASAVPPLFPPAVPSVEVPPIDEARSRMYETVYSGEAQPEYNEATCLSNTLVLPDTRVVTLEVELSREVVPLRSAYTAVGRLAKLKVGVAEERVLTICSAPFPNGARSSDSRDVELDESIKNVLVKLRGDLSAHAVKEAAKLTSVKAPLQLWVTRSEAPEVFDMQPGELASVGYFQGEGLYLRPFLGVFQYPVVLIFASGKGMATAKALIEATSHSGLTLRARADVRLYVSASIDAELPFSELYERWQADHHVKVKPCVLTRAAGSSATQGGVREGFDSDDVEYDPPLTMAVILGDEEFEKEVLELLDDAHIPAAQAVLGSQEAPPVFYYKSSQV